MICSKCEKETNYKPGHEDYYCPRCRNLEDLRSLEDLIATRRQFPEADKLEG